MITTLADVRSRVLRVEGSLGKAVEMLVRKGERSIAVDLVHGTGLFTRNEAKALTQMIAGSERVVTIADVTVELLPDSDGLTVEMRTAIVQPVKIVEVEA